MGMIACRQCYRVFYPPSLPSECPNEDCDGRRIDYQDDPDTDLWILFKSKTK